MNSNEEVNSINDGISSEGKKCFYDWNVNFDFNGISTCGESN